MLLSQDWPCLEPASEGQGVSRESKVKTVNTRQGTEDHFIAPFEESLTFPAFPHLLLAGLEQAPDHDA